MSTDTEFSVRILQEVLQAGDLDFKLVVDGLMDLTGSVTGQFFEVIQNKVVCRYNKSSSKNDEEAFFPGSKYTFDEIPLEQYPIFHKTDIIAFICLDKVDVIEGLSNAFKMQLHDSVCVGLLLAKAKESKYSFVIALCRNLVKTVNQAAEMLANENFPSSSQKTVLDVGELLTEVLNVINNAIDYTNIDAERVVLKAEDVNVSSFINELKEYIQFVSPIRIEINDNVNKNLYFDKDRVQQIFETVLTRVADISFLRLTVRLDNYSTSDDEQYYLSCKLFSDESKNTDEIVKRFSTDKFAIENLGVFLVKRLCEIMSGTFSTSDTGVLIKIKVDIPSKIGSARGKHILIGTDNITLYKDLSGALNDMGAFSTLMSDAMMLTENVGRFDVVIMDKDYARYSQFVSKQGIPVIGVTNKSDNLLGSFNAIVTLPLSQSFLKSKVEDVLVPYEITHNKFVCFTKDKSFFSVLARIIQNLGDSSIIVPLETIVYDLDTFDMIFIDIDHFPYISEDSLKRLTRVAPVVVAGSNVRKYINNPDVMVLNEISSNAVRHVIKYSKRNINKNTSW